MDMDAEDHTPPSEVWWPLPADPEQTGLNGTLTESQAQLWALVLESRHLPYRAERSTAGWLLMVPPARYAVAQEEIRRFTEENRNWPPAAPPARVVDENSLSTLSVLVLLATFHNVTRLDLPLFGHGPPDWSALGSADAALIMAGQWWRAITALTLHANVIHLASNLGIGGIFIFGLCRELGTGLAWILLLGAGVMGNLVNAWLHPPNHSSVGASTAVFGAVGIMAALNLLRHRHRLERHWPVPVAAGLALLALLGSEGERTDLGAHLFGFGAGFILGLAAESLVGRFGRPGTLANALLALSSALAVGWSWWLALGCGL